jgi:hypothetical protein
MSATAAGVVGHASAGAMQQPARALAARTNSCVAVLGHLLDSDATRRVSVHGNEKTERGARGRASNPSPVLAPVPAPGAGFSSSVRSFASCAFRRPRW